jgi:YVTN family beta-propeller protein
MAGTQGLIADYVNPAKPLEITMYVNSSTVWNPTLVIVPVVPQHIFKYFNMDAAYSLTSTFDTSFNYNGTIQASNGCVSCINPKAGAPPAWLTSLANLEVGTGPFVLRSWDGVGQHGQLLRNPTYYRAAWSANDTNNKVSPGGTFTFKASIYEWTYDRFACINSSDRVCKVPIVSGATATLNLLNSADKTIKTFPLTCDSKGVCSGPVDTTVGGFRTGDNKLAFIAQYTYQGLARTWYQLTGIYMVPSTSATQPTVTSVNVGAYPSGVAVNPSTGNVYVTDNGDKNVSVIGAASKVTTIHVGNGPMGVAVNPSTGDVYVVNNNDNTVSVISGSTGRVVDTIPVGNAPEGVAVNNSTNTVYVVNSNDNTVSVISGSTNRVIATINVGDGPTAVGVNPSTNRVYVADSIDGNVSVIDGSTNKVTANITTGTSPVAVAVNPTTGLVYVADNVDNTVSVISGSTNTVTGSVAVGTGPSAVAVDPITNAVFVANFNDNTVSVIDGSTNQVTLTIPVGNSPDAIAVYPTTGLVYAGNYGDNTVSVINGATSAQTKTTSSSTSSTSSSTSSTTSSSSSSGGGGIPEFPPQMGLALVVTVIVLASYVLARRVSAPRFRGPSFQ